tara:strand:+ start:14468 stop:15760 length:1293 start_codon:yes stop_codon:yes gene_type:complete
MGIIEEIKIFTKYILSNVQEIINGITLVFSRTANFASKNKLEFLVGVLILVWVYGMFYLFGKDPYKIASTYRITSTSLTLFILFLMLMTFTFIRTRKDIFKDDPQASQSDKYPGIFGFNLKVFIIVLFGYLIFNSGGRIIVKIMEQGFVKNIIEVLLNMLMIGGLIALGYKALASGILNKFGKTKSLLMLIVNVILIIPCKITEFFEFLHRQIQITPNVTWFILLFQAVYLVGYFLIPYLIKHTLQSDGILLQKEPIYLSRETSLASVQDLRPKEKTSWFSLDPQKKVDYNFSISSWVRINPQPPNVIANGNENIPILKYGGKPDITYNVRDNRFEVSVVTKTGQQKIVYSNDNFPLQKWNHIVMNFETGTLDVFMNGKLLISENNLLTARDNEPIISGDKRGVEGGIRNVYYFPYILSKQQINSLNLDL